MSLRPTSLQVGIGWILRAGVALSLILESAGLFLNYLQTMDTGLPLEPSWLAGRGNFFSFTYSAALSLGAGATPLSLIELGVAVLILTPYARIVAAIVYYLLERDWTYVSITFAVFLVINAGLIFL